MGFVINLLYYQNHIDIFDYILYQGNPKIILFMLHEILKYLEG